MAGYDPPPKPKPIRYDLDTWVVIRNDPAVPKALIQRVHHADGEDRFLLFKWALEPEERRLMNVCYSLEEANQLVKYDTPKSQGIYHGPPNGITDTVARERLEQERQKGPRPDALQEGAGQAGASR